MKRNSVRTRTTLIVAEKDRSNITEVQHSFPKISKFTSVGILIPTIALKSIRFQINTLLIVYAMGNYNK